MDVWAPLHAGRADMIQSLQARGWRGATRVEGNPVRTSHALFIGLAVACALAGAALGQGAPAPVPYGADRPALARALGQVGLTLETAAISARQMSFWGQDAYKLPLFGILQEDAYEALDWMRVLGAGQVAAGRGSIKDALAQAGRRIGLQVTRGWIDDPFPGLGSLLDADPVAALNEGIRRLGTVAGVAQEARTAVVATEDLVGVPAPVVRAAARIVYGAAQAARFRNLAFAPLGSLSEGDLLAYARAAWLGEDDGGNGGGSLEAGAAIWRAYGEIDREYMLAGAEDLAIAVDAALADLTAEPVGGPYSVRIETGVGPIVLDGERDTAHDGTALLIIDAAGNDTYEGCGSSSGRARPAGVAIDLAGDDSYVATQAGVLGCGLGGYGFVCDLSGNDRYAATHASQGVGVYGVGVLLDGDGDDEYVVESMGQGAAVAGIGLLIDRAGADRYECYTNSQGFGFTYGCGMVTDLSGDDIYTANDTDIRYPSPQTAEHNVSMAQGAGYGARGDYLDGHSTAGGFGCLADGAGNDAYSCGVFGQGVGYWYGIGLLADLGGDDSYSGVWYTQGSAAHFAIGLLWDGAGNDRYRATHNMAIGAGHDLSLGILLEDGGADEYDAPNLSLGGGNANGIGIFLDRGGKDTYRVSAGTTLGRANIGTRGTPRDLMLCLGLFADLGGDEDSYPEVYPFARDGALWTQAGSDAAGPLPTECGVGIDQ